MTRERPILFSEPMIRALLAGKKTQTRRVVKQRPIPPDCTTEWTENARFRYDGVWDSVKQDGDDEHYLELLDEQKEPLEDYFSVGRCPFGMIGDRLWVRERWRRVDWPGHKSAIEYKADWGREGGKLRWKPAIFMPRVASRITLKITDIRVERLQDISEKDALAEGVARLFRGITRYDGEAKDTFKWLWEKLHGQNSWEQNPLVWVISFSLRGTKGVKRDNGAANPAADPARPEVESALDAPVGGRQDRRAVAWVV